MGNPVVHWELMSKDPARVAAFYERVFDWKIQHMPELNYRMVDTGGEGGINGGILKPQREGPWPGNMLFYINVDDLAAIAERSSKPAARSTSRSRRSPEWARSRCSPTPRAA